MAEHDISKWELAAEHAALFDSFMALSAVLVDRDDLERWAGHAYLFTLVRGSTDGQSKAAPAYSAADIVQTLETFAGIAASEPPDLAAAVVEGMLAPGGQVAVVTRSITCLWYCAALLDLSEGSQGFIVLAAPKETYPLAQVWQSFGGNPMGIPGPYYGNWSYPGTVPIVEPSRLSPGAGGRGRRPSSSGRQEQSGGES